MGLGGEDGLVFGVELALEILEDGLDLGAVVGDVAVKPSAEGAGGGGVVKLGELRLGELGADALADANFEFLGGVVDEGAFLGGWHVAEANFVHELFVNLHGEITPYLSLLSQSVSGMSRVRRRGGGKLGAGEEQGGEKLGAGEAADGEAVGVEGVIGGVDAFAEIEGEIDGAVG